MQKHKVKTNKFDNPSSTDHVKRVLTGGNFSDKFSKKQNSEDNEIEKHTFMKRGTWIKH